MPSGNKAPSRAHSNDNQENINIIIRLPLYGFKRREIVHKDASLPFFSLFSFKLQIAPSEIRKILNTKAISGLGDQSVYFLLYWLLCTGAEFWATCTKRNFSRAWKIGQHHFVERESESSQKNHSRATIAFLSDIMKCGGVKLNPTYGVLFRLKIRSLLFWIWFKQQ